MTTDLKVLHNVSDTAWARELLFKYLYIIQHHFPTFNISTDTSETMTGIGIKFHAFLNDDKVEGDIVPRGERENTSQSRRLRSFPQSAKSQKGFNKGEDAEAEEPIFMFMVPNYFRAAENENKTKGDKLGR